MARSLALPTPASPGTGLRRLRTTTGRAPAVTFAIAVAWLLLAGAQLTGTAELLHHHALIEHGPALWIALPAFLAAWLVMVVAMMLPASMPAIGSHLAAVARPTMPLARFLGPYALVWGGFGVAVFLGDTVVHRVVHASPWLEARTWLIDGAVLGFAGVYQLLPIKRRSLEACRHAGALLTEGRRRFAGRFGGRFSPGLDHALACLAASGALMLLMFSEGFSSPVWMVALTAVMTYEAVGRHGTRAATVVGLLLLAAGLGVVATGQVV